MFGIGRLSESARKFEWQSSAVCRLFILAAQSFVRTKLRAQVALEKREKSHFHVAPRDASRNNGQPVKGGGWEVGANSLCPPFVCSIVCALSLSEGLRARA